MRPRCGISRLSLDYRGCGRNSGGLELNGRAMTDGKTDDEYVDLADQRDLVADRRDFLAGQRDARSDKRDQAITERELKVDMILATAEIRDARAAARDFDADQRDQADLLYAIVHDVDDTRLSQGRSLAGKDRLSSKTDRIASQVDRTVLANVGPTGDESYAATKDALTAAAERSEAAKVRDRAAKQRGRSERTLRIVTPEEPPRS